MVAKSIKGQNPKTQNTYTPPRTFALIGGIIFVSFVIVVVAVSAIWSHFSNPYRDEQATIANLPEYTKGRPSDSYSVEYIRHKLFQTIKLNSDVDPTTLKDIYIRKGSFSQMYDEIKDIHNVNFLVDIDSLKHTYSVKYQWSSKKDNDQLDEYGTIVSCPSKQQSAYKDFDCKDELIITNGRLDPLVGELPYESKYFHVEMTDSDPAHPKLLVEIFVFLYETDYDQREAFVDTVKESFTNWLRSKNVDPAKYEISYQVTID